MTIGNVLIYLILTMIAVTAPIDWTVDPDARHMGSSMPLHVTATAKGFVATGAWEAAMGVSGNL